MTAATRTRLLSLEGWRALGEDTESRAELQEGVLFVSPRPSSKHSLALSRLWSILDAAAPNVYAVREEVDVVIDPRTLATVRVPDVVVLREGAVEPYAAADVLLAVEVLSPGTRRVDLVMKRSEYADAGIPRYWIIDLESSSLESLVLTETGYESTTTGGPFSATEPFEVTVDLDRLT